MGVRIKKVLGYALTDIVEHDLRLKRPIDEVFAELDENEDECATRFLAATKALENWETSSIQPDFDPLDMLDTGSESGDIVTFIPAGKAKRWTRYDDDIDYFEARADAGPKAEIYWPQNSLKKIHGPIYHYDKYVDRRCPDFLGEKTVKITELINLIGGYVAVSKSEVSLEALGYTKQEFLRYVRPYIPLSIRIFCEVFDIFHDPEMVWELEPAVHTYWG